MCARRIENMHLGCYCLLLHEIVSVLESDGGDRGWKDHSFKGSRIAAIAKGVGYCMPYARSKVPSTWAWALTIIASASRASEWFPACRVGWSCAGITWRVIQIPSAHGTLCGVVYARFYC